MFSAPQFLPTAVFEKLTDLRVHDPEFAWRSARSRLRRDRLAPNGKLNILAADHPARRVTRVGEDALAMCDRHDYLARILRVLASGRVDGVMATMDILEDLLTIDGLLRDAGGEPSAGRQAGHRQPQPRRPRRLRMGAGRSGHRPLAGQLPGVETRRRQAAAARGRQRARVAPDADWPARRPLRKRRRARCPCFWSRCPVTRTDKGYTVVKTAEALARLAGVASALGDSSRYLWLKLPYCEGYRVVARSTTLPILLLGGESAGDRDALPGPAPRGAGGRQQCARRAGRQKRTVSRGRKIRWRWPMRPAASSTTAGPWTRQFIHAKRIGGATWIGSRATSDARKRRRRSMETRRVTMAQALLGFLKNQYVERDGREHRFFEGAWGIFGHGIIAGFGQALQQNPDFPYYLCRNEQAAVHIATAFAKARNRLNAFACLSSIGPGATNMITGAATATINRLPVLLLPGDIFARRNVAPVLQQLESERSQDISRERCVQAGLALLGSHQPAGSASLFGGGGDARADLSGADRRRGAGAAPGRADRGLGLPGGDVREARVAHPAASAGARHAAAGGGSHSRGPKTAGRGRRRCDLQRSRRSTGEPAAAHRNPGRRDAGGQRARCHSTIRRTSARLASPARRGRTSPLAKRTW